MAAALLVDAGHDVVGATMKLWGGPSDSGCCSVADVDDARRVAQQLGIAHHVFNFTDDFDRDVVDPYVADHAAGRHAEPVRGVQPAPQVRPLPAPGRAAGLRRGGHRASRPGPVRPTAGWRLRRGADRAKDQSYVLHMLGQAELARVLLPVGELTKAEVRDGPRPPGLRTAAKPDSQDVCFISRPGAARQFLGARIPLHPGRPDRPRRSRRWGRCTAVELVTVGQRRGLGALPGPKSGRRYVVDVDVAAATVTVGPLEDLLTDRDRRARA